MFRFSVRFGLLLSLLAWTAFLRGDSNPGIVLTNAAQLLIDDYLIAQSDRLTRRPHVAQKYFPNPVLTYTKPWEGHCVLAWGSVLYDREDKLFKCWYEVYRQNEPREKRSSFLYATSKDGLYWDKPSLDLVEYDGSRENNIVFQPKYGIDSAVVIKDFDDPDAKRRYKMMYYLMAERKGPQAGPWGLYTAISEDGIRWHPSQEPAVKAGDRSGFFFNPFRKVYTFLSRPGFPAPVTSVHRWIGIWESSDFRSFGEMHPALWPDRADGAGTEFYSLQPFAYESVLLGYLEMFYHGESDRRYRRLDTQLAISRDGLQWSRALERKVVLPYGPIGAWDGGWAFPTSNPPIRVGDKLYVFYQGRRSFHWGTRPYSFQQEGQTYEINDPNFGHVGSIGLAFWRVDGFASMDADKETGTLLTKPVIIPSGDQLIINARSTGHIKISILNESGQPFPGYSSAECLAVKGDSIEHTVGWEPKQNIQELRGRTVRLRFELQDASLYSFRIQ